MKDLSGIDEHIHVLNGEIDARSVIRTICETGVQEAPFYLCDMSDVIRKQRQWKEKMPQIMPYYAVKCNDNLTLIKVLAAMGTGFDCASKAEIDQILDLGVDASRIIYSNPVKQPSYLSYAAAKGIQLMTFDNETELHRIKALHPTARLLLRIRFDCEVAMCQLGLKFGCDPETEAPRLLVMAHTLGLKVVGINFHVGSGSVEPPIFRDAIAAARSLFDLGAELGYKMDLLNLGGGFPGHRASSINEFAETVNQAVADYFPSPGVQVIAEPGRYYVASAYTLATCIHSRRVVRCKNLQDVESIMYYINDGAYGSFNSRLKHHMETFPIPLDGSSGKIPSIVWGPTCDNFDLVNENVLLPLMNAGDWIIYEEMGDYTLPVTSRFNGFSKPKVHTVVTETDWLMIKDSLPLSEANFKLGNIATGS